MLLIYYKTWSEDTVILQFIYFTEIQAQFCLSVGIYDLQQLQSEAVF